MSQETTDRLTASDHPLLKKLHQAIAAFDRELGIDREKFEPLSEDQLDRLAMERRNL